MKNETKNEATYVEISGKFTFSINQSGLDYNDKKERQQAIKDFWEVWGKFLDDIENLDHIPSFDWDANKLLVEEGE